MSSMDPMKGGSWILSETMRRTSLRPSRLRQLLNTKSSSLMRQITQPTMYNSSYGHLLRNLVATADLSSLVTTKTKLSNPSIPVAPLWSFPLQESKNQELQQSFSQDFSLSSPTKESSSTTKFSLNSSTSTSQTGEESSMSVRGTRWVGRLIRASLRRLRK